jgi:hypothetical protein
VNDHDCEALVRLHLQQVAWHEIGGRFFAIARKAGDGFGAQVGDLVGGGVVQRAKSADRLSPGKQQVALDQIGQAIVRVLAQQVFRELQRVVQSIAFDFGKNARQCFFRSGVGNDQRQGRIFAGHFGCCPREGYRRKIIDGDGSICPLVCQSGCGTGGQRDCQPGQNQFAA